MASSLTPNYHKIGISRTRETEVECIRSLLCRVMLMSCVLAAHYQFSIPFARSNIVSICIGCVAMCVDCIESTRSAFGNSFPFYFELNAIFFKFGLREADCRCDFIAFHGRNLSRPGEIPSGMTCVRSDSRLNTNKVWDPFDVRSHAASHRNIGATRYAGAGNAAKVLLPDYMIQFKPIYFVRNRQQN